MNGNASRNFRTPQLHSVFVYLCVYVCAFEHVGVWRGGEGSSSRWWRCTHAQIYNRITLVFHTFFTL